MSEVLKVGSSTAVDVVVASSTASFVTIKQTSGALTSFYVADPTVGSRQQIPAGGSYIFQSTTPYEPNQTVGTVVMASGEIVDITVEELTTGGAAVSIPAVVSMVAAGRVVVGINPDGSFSSAPGGGGSGAPGSPDSSLQGNNDGVFAGVPGSSLDFTNGLVTLAPTGVGVALTLYGDSSEDDILDIWTNTGDNIGCGFFDNGSSGVGFYMEDDSSNSVEITPTGSSWTFGGTSLLFFSSDGLADSSNSFGTSGQVLSSTGAGGIAWVGAGSGSPGGSDGQLQYNNSGTFGGTLFTYVAAGGIPGIFSTFSFDGDTFYTAWGNVEGPGFLIEDETTGTYILGDVSGSTAELSIVTGNVQTALRPNSVTVTDGSTPFTFLSNSGVLQLGSANATVDPNGNASFSQGSFFINNSDGGTVLVCSCTVNDTTDNGSSAIGIAVMASLVGSAVNTDTVFGIQVSVFNNSTGVAAASEATGVMIIGNNSPPDTQAVIVTGIHIADQAAHGPGSTVNAGILIDNQTAGENVYAIQTGLGPVSFGDSLFVSAASAGAQILLANGGSGGTEITDGGGGGTLIQCYNGTAEMHIVNNGSGGTTIADGGGGGMTLTSDVAVTINGAVAIDVGGNLNLTAGLVDSTTSLGTSGQVLSSTGSAVAWIDAGGGGSVALNDITTPTGITELNLAGFDFVVIDETGTSEIAFSSSTGFGIANVVSGSVQIGNEGGGGIALADAGGGGISLNVTAGGGIHLAANAGGFAISNTGGGTASTISDSSGNGLTVTVSGGGSLNLSSDLGITMSGTGANGTTIEDSGGAGISLQADASASVMSIVNLGTGGTFITDSGGGGISIVSTFGSSFITISNGGSGGTTITDSGVGIILNGSIGFFNGSPAPQQTVTGAKLPSDVALASLLDALAAYGLIIDSTT